MSAQVHLISAHAATYADLCQVPEGYTAELINGTLHALPRPRGRHIHSASILGRRLGGPYEDGIDGPGGWWILDEPEIHFALDTEVTVPDLAGWRRERMPAMPDDHKFRIVPDWICEILSPRTRDYDLHEKMPLYARFGVPFLWLMDLDGPWLSAHVLNPDRSWHQVGQFGPGDVIQAPPFDAAAFELF